MILTTFVLILSILFLAGFFNLIKLPNSQNKLLLLLKSPFYPSSACSPVVNPSASSPKVNPMSMNMEKAKIKQVFDTFDKNGDGYITQNELLESLKNIGMEIPRKEVEEMMGSLDSNSDGLVDIDEFHKLFELVEKGRNKRQNDEEKRDSQNEDEDEDDDDDLKEAFDVFDGDKDGLITFKELGLVLTSLGLKEGKREEDCKEMIRKVDVDGDGMVNFYEFKRMMKGGVGFDAASTLVHAF